MHSSCWVKIFEDKTSETGYDSDISKGLASWSKGRLDNIAEVFLSFGWYAASLSALNTEWYQYDRYSIVLGEDSSPKRISRFIQARITKEYNNLYLCYNDNNSHLVWISVKNESSDKSYQIQARDIGKWITICLLYNTLNIFIGDKGSRNGEQLFK